MPVVVLNASQQSEGAFFPTKISAQRRRFCGDNGGRWLGWLLGILFFFFAFVFYEELVAMRTQVRARLAIGSFADVEESKADVLNAKEERRKASYVEEERIEEKGTEKAHEWKDFRNVVLQTKTPRASSSRPADTASCEYGDVKEISRRDFEERSPESDFHIIIGGFQYLSDFHLHYIWDINIPGARIVVYRRERPDVEARAWRGRCAMYGEERLLFPNRGRDASAFWDYVLWKYESPPRAVAFLHGHVAQAWHTSCEAIFTRLHAYERAMYGVEGFSPVPNSLVTLTDPAHGQQSGEEPLYWFGDLSGGVREANPETEAVEGSCQDILKTVNITLSNVDVTSCCGSFILPGVWTQGHPRAVYEALFRAVVDETKDDALTSKQCFEFIVYALFSPKFLPVGFTRDEMYDRNGLIQWFHNARVLQDEVRPLMRRCKGNSIS